MPEPDDEMTVDAWAEAMKRKIDRFAEWWKRKAWEKPDEFPDLMSSGEWEENWHAVHGEWVERD